MKNEKNGAGKDQRVVLNLNMQDAKKVADGFYCLAGDQDGYGEELREFFRVLGQRVTKTINKHEIESGIAGVITAAQEVIGEMDADKRIKQLNEGNEKCPGCGSGATLPEPDGTLLCEGCGAIFGGKK